MLSEIIVLGLIMISIGTLLLFLAIILSILRKSPQGKVEGGGVIIIGPIPIIIGSSQKVSFALLILSIILVALLIILCTLEWWVS